MTRSIGSRSALAALIVLTMGLAAPAALADDQQALVDRARITVESFAGDAKMAPMRALLKRAKAVLVVPQMLKAGFILGGAGGSGVLLARGQRGWSAPAFFNLGAGSIGLQIGAQSSEVVLLMMTERALDAVLHNRVKLGAELSAAAGPQGVGRETATTTNLRDEVYSYSRNKGLFAGASVEGAVIQPDADANKAYYGKAVTPQDIILKRAVSKRDAAALRAALAKAAGG